MAAPADKCPEAIGWHDAGRDGRCHWCGRKVERAAPRPRGPFDPTGMDLAYRYFFDPDFGRDKEDVY
jgi:hypothetical protein